MPKLNEIEESLSEEELFFKWLQEEKVSFLSLSRLYTRYLENKDKKQTTRISNYTNLLAQYLQYANLSEKNEWVKDKTIGTLYAYGDFKSAPIYDIWGEIIEQNKINTNIDSIAYEIYKNKEK